MIVVSRNEALKRGVKHYWTGKPCKRGHIDLRNVSSFACVTCSREKARELCEASKDRGREKARLRWVVMTETQRTKKRATWRKSGATYYAAHKEARARQAKKRHDSNPATIEARQFRAQQREWEAGHPVIAALIRKATQIAIRKRHRARHAREIAKKRAAQWVRDKSKAAQKYREWCRANKESVNARNSLRYASRLAAVPEWVDTGAIQRVYALAAKRSTETGIRHEVDHIYPMKSPLVCGLHVPWNLRVTTKSQNCSKGNRMPTEDEIRPHTDHSRYPCAIVPQRRQPSFLDRSLNLVEDSAQAPMKRRTDRRHLS